MNAIGAMKAMLSNVLLMSLIGTGACQIATTNSQPALASGVTSGATPYPDGGPIAHGLQLRLAIHETDPTDSGRHALDLTLRNTSLVTVVVGTDPVPGRRDEGLMAFVDALHQVMWFAVYPEIQYDAPQVLASEPVEVEPCSLRGGEELSFSWETPNDRIHGKVPSQAWDGGFLFPSDGLYFVRAGVDLKIGGGESLRIWSNEVPVTVGGKRTPPKPPIAVVRSFDLTTGDSVLGVGSKSGVQVGDVYEVRLGLESGWRFVVSDAKSNYALAHVEQYGEHYGGPIPKSRQEQILTNARAFLTRPHGAVTTTRSN